MNHHGDRTLSHLSFRASTFPWIVSTPFDENSTDLMSSHALDLIFKPRSVAIIGASSDPAKPGGRAFAYLRAHFKGDIFPINAKPFDCAPYRVAARIDDLECVPDLAIIAVPASVVEQQLTSCAAKGIKAAVIFTAGFAELGGEQEAQQQRIAAIARDAGMRLLGPNCLGCFNTHAGAFTTFTAVISHAMPPTGSVAILSQSGAIGAHLLSMIRDVEIGTSLWVATGNECDIDVADCIDYAARDPNSKTIVVYLEGCRNGRKLVDALMLAKANGKPVIVLKAGSSPEGAAAAASHTGALVGSDQVFDAAFAECGAYRARSYEEIVDLVMACSGGVFPRGRRFGIATNSGGAGILLADYARDAKLEVPELAPDLQARLKDILPLAGVRNPVDTTATAMTRPDLLGQFLDTLLGAENIDMAVLYLSMMGRNSTLLTEMRKVLRGVRQKYPEKPVALIMTVPAETQREIESEGFLVFEDPARAVHAMAALAQLSESLVAPPRTAPQSRSAQLAEITGGGEAAGLAVLKQAGIPVVEARLVGSAAQAAEAARDIAAPLAMKIASPDIPHKSESGGVRLGVEGAEAAEIAYREILETVGQRAPDARIEGVLIAPMISGGVEVILGTTYDAVFGPVVMFGLGGIFVEIYRDVVYRLAPVSESEAAEMIREIQGYPILAGARGREPFDLAVLAQALSALSHLAAENPGIESIDVNPFIALAKGGYAVDALIVPKRAKPSNH